MVIMENMNLNDQCICSENDDDYKKMIDSVNRYFIENLNKHKYLFRANVSKLFNVFLSEIPAELRQRYNCNTCHSFIHQFGNLVYIDENFRTHSALWRNDYIIESHRSAFSKMAELVERNKINDIFITDQTSLGKLSAGGYDHLSVTLPVEYSNTNLILNSHQLMAEKIEDYRTLQKVLNKFNKSMVNDVIGILKSNSKYPIESTLATAEWLRNIYTLIEELPHFRANIVWSMVASAPAGWCHIQSNKLGSLLNDLKNGMQYDEIIRRFKENVINPHTNNHPQKAPSDGNINQAEVIIKKLGIKDSLRRRYATIDDMQKYWQPTLPEKVGVDNDLTFQHLRSDKKPSSDIVDSLPSILTTWEKFDKEILPDALEIEFLVPNYADNYITFVTAVDATAKPILQWDREDCRNSVSWFIRTVTEKGSHNRVLPATDAQCLNIKPNTFHRISAISLMPYMWNNLQLGNFKPSVVLILDGVYDRLCDKNCNGGKNLGLALFPSILRSELHSIRATIEAFSNAGELEGDLSSSVCGLCIEKDNEVNITLRVKTKDSILKYKIDRW